MRRLARTSPPRPAIVQGRPGPVGEPGCVHVEARIHEQSAVATRASRGRTRDAAREHHAVERSERPIGAHGAIW